MAVTLPTLDAAKEARKWKKELHLATKREKDWLRDAEKIVKRYRGEEKKKNRFNVLWSNTEILRPAIYNTRPNPDVRRRFRDPDLVGKAVSEVLERALYVFIDGDEFDTAMRNDLLDGLLGGRGLSRIRYVPQITRAPAPPRDEGDEGDEDADRIDMPSQEELTGESVCTEHVDFRDFRHGYGRVWAEVPWEGFRHKLSRPEAETKFGRDALGTLEFAVPSSDEDKRAADQVGETEKIAEFWEIWDKTGQRVFFLQTELDNLLYPLDNPDGEVPIEFDGFYPAPMPLYIVEDTGSLLPIPMFQLYEEQANELDSISLRIDRIVKALRIRGIYDARLKEMVQATQNDDNELTPVENAQAWLEGGLDKAISWFPTEKAVEVLQALYDARERQKAIIDEILGISDIVRGATDPNETASAQALKSGYHSVRLQRMQGAMQRYARDVLRLAAQAMSQKFSPQTFAHMTELNFPTAQEKALAQAQFAQAQMLAQQPGQPPASPPTPPAVLQMPTWDDIFGIMRSERMRQYRIDIETDSTVAQQLDSDLTGMAEVLKAISETLQGLQPLVAAGALPADSAKDIVMGVVRRARLGNAVEDALEKLQAPRPQPPPPEPSVEVAKIKAQSDQALAQAKTQAEAQLKQADLAHSQALESAKAHAEVQADGIRNQMEYERAQKEAELNARIEMQKMAHERELAALKEQSESQRRNADLETQRQIADANNQTKVIIAQIAAAQQKAMADQSQAHDLEMAKPAPEPKRVDAVAPTAADFKADEAFAPLMKRLDEMAEKITRPRKVVRDEAGRIAGLE